MAKIFNFSSKNKIKKDKPEKKRSPSVRIAKNIYRKNALKKFFNIFSYTIIITIVIYISFALTILRVLPTNTDLGFVPVKNITFPGGVARPGDLMVMNTKEKQDGTMANHLKQAFIPNSNVILVETIGGPFGKINWVESGIISIEGKPMPVKVKEKPDNEFLNDEYLVKCLGGDCVVGEGLIISKENVYGEPVSLGGK